LPALGSRFLAWEVASWRGKSLPGLGSHFPELETDFPVLGQAGIAGAKKPPGLPRRLTETMERPNLGLAEVELHAQADDPGADDLEHVVCVAALQTEVALENGRLVGGVEHVRAHGEAEVLERELLLHAEVEDAHIVVPNLVGTVHDRNREAERTVGDVTTTLRARAADPLVVVRRIALPAGQVRREVEAPRTLRSDLVETV